ncbi:ribonuclease HI [Candidatus Nomurabacteria bacterium RIFCSPHIGHO2_01_FULL_37_25]|uniref:Ribonuclease H n=1 Tax=Candidatus Nomurabacteria bacterium RIFCSPLOWO2_01_FULL_36_16 TaxID=1801767 RepID=A0A1F6WYD0_9BACT|nr:MAG: ribonuclease HI [Candidatus Nomurabacteria bacterium RIFCSPHIGHO2_01_FULL_37_25]OGI75272.1 MAG: ribonuclease HI [Candidatus Nomurabacteria bacterium RIFCSPHIGHO2_02_FULL_36_29]OGI86899.1 MAG: ribonuclease HI [Candidatus Nomurabacteria bacterium RIFCSPLOWO2_01_FULL_36_16]
MTGKIIIYTDGSARGNPGPAGWGAIIMIYNDEEKVENKKLKVVELGGRVDHATNNIMELTAPIESLKYLQQNKIENNNIEIFSDSKYVITGINEWILNWMNNNWRTANKKPVLNKELWQELHELNKEFKPKWNYVKGHNNDEHNDRADLIATSFADGEPVELRNKK